MDMELVPSFGILHDIIIVDNEFFFVCKVLSTVSFEGHFHSYLVTCENSFSIITQANLYDHTTLSVYNISNSFYIPLKYQLIENVWYCNNLAMKLKISVDNENDLIYNVVNSSS